MMSRSVTRQDINILIRLKGTRLEVEKPGEISVSVYRIVALNGVNYFTCG